MRWLEPDLIGFDPSGVEENWNRLLYGYTRWSSGIIPRAALSLSIWPCGTSWASAWECPCGVCGRRCFAEASPRVLHPLEPRPTQLSAAYADLAIETVKKGWDWQ